MATDRELLELAAKACGYQILRVYTDARCLYIDPGPNENGFHWNPLTSDGDALRLAAKLRLTISPGKHKGDGCTVEAPRGIAPGCTAFRDDDTEQMRYAIVHVAASIGETMP